METQQDLNDSLPLPADKMPECWEKDERMNYLFAQFRNRSVNPQDWDSKYKFWRGMISDWCKYKTRSSFSLSDLNKAFKRNGRTPVCLSVVVQELYRTGEIVPVTDFVRESPNTWGSWAVDTLMKRPLYWSFSTLKNKIVEPSVEPEMRYVHLETVETLGKTILSTIDKNEENVLRSISDVTKNCTEKTKSKRLSNEDIKLALIWLRHNKKAAFQLGPVHDSSNILVKLAHSNVEGISEVEENLYNLEKQEEQLLKNLEMLELEKETLLKTTKAYLANGMRQVAKSSLRKKKELEKSIEKRAGALQNIQVLIARVRDAHSDSKVLSSYKTGAAALKKKLKEDGLTEDNVADTMNDLSQVLEEFSEIESVMSKSVELYDSELEDELAELLAESSSDSITPSQVTPVKPKRDHKKLDIENLPDITKELSSLRLKDVPPPPKHLPSGKSPVPSPSK